MAAMMMIMPPMVGVPFFCCSPAGPGRAPFANLLFLQKIDQFFTKNGRNKSDKIMAIITRKEIN
jgi:hypothetical protein